MSEAAYALPQTVVFIDASLPDLATLRAGLPAEATVHLLDPAHHGLKQMAAVLAGQFDIAALHLIAHGAPGQLLLGHAAIDIAALKACREDITTIAAAMAEDGELLIYGCEVAAGREGRQFIHTLTSMTGLKVAAATHKVGATALGGHWTLDDMPAAMTAQPLRVSAWQGVLAITKISAFTPAPQNLININGTLYFTVNGIELWKSDGTAGGTVKVKDGWTTQYGSGLADLTKIGNKLFFTAYDETNGRELWTSDGTLAGTVLVKDIQSGSSYGSPNSGYPAMLTDFNDMLYFSASDGANGAELWKSDGTASGTVMVKDIYADAFSASSPSSLTNINGTLYFAAYDATNGYELWKSDGTEGGTVLVKDIRTGSSSSDLFYLTNVNGTLYFKAHDGIHGEELWKSDGTEGGTVMVKDIKSNDNGFTPMPYALTKLTAAIGSTLYFVADDGSTGNELWKSDGTEGGTVMVKDIKSGSASSSPANLTNVNGTLYFTANDFVFPGGGLELWKSDGTEAGTVMVKNINAQSYGSSSPANLTNVNGTLYFTANDGINGIELWKSDGTEAGTVLVQNINTAAYSGSTPANLTSFNSGLFFGATDDDGTGLFSYTDVDTTAPVFQSAATSTDGTKIILTYNEALSATTAAADTYRVFVGVSTNTVTAASVSGSTVELTLTTPLTYGEQATVYYDAPASNSANTNSAVQDTAGNDAADLMPPTGGASVTNNVPVPVTHTSATYDESTNTLTLTGTRFNTLLESSETASTDIKARLDWSKLSWDINGDNTTTADVGFVVGDITSAKVTNSTTLTIVLADAKGTSLEGTTGYGTIGGADKLDIATGFARNTALNAATTDALADGPLTLLKTITYSATTFAEAPANDGSITASITLTLAGDTFAGANDVALAGAVVTNVPNGLTAVVTKTSDTVATVTFTGTATAHANANDIANLTITLGNTAFTGGSATAVSNATKADLVIDFANPILNPTLTSVTTLTGVTEGTQKEITLANLLTAGDEADPDGAVEGFVVTALSTGTLKIGADASSATDWNATTNATIDATHKAFWTPAANANGALSAFTVKAKDDGGLLSATAVQVTVDVTPAPGFQSATVSDDGTKVILTYDEALSTTTAALGAFAVYTAGGYDSNAVTAVAVNGSTVELTLTNTIIGGDIVNVTYTDPTADNDTNAVQDSTGNDAATLPWTRVTNTLIDTTPPVFKNARTDNTGTKVYVYYKESLSTTTAAASAFTVKVGGTTNVVTAVAAGTVETGGTAGVQLTLTTAVRQGDTVTVAYTAPESNNANTNNAVQDVVGYDAASLPETPVTNWADNTPPVYWYGATSTDGTKIILTFYDGMSTTTAPASMFRVTTGGMPNAVTAVSVAYSKIELTLTTPVTYGQSVSVVYFDDNTNVDGTNVVQDQAGNDIARIFAPDVTNAVPETTPPVFQSAATSTDGTKVILTYNEALSATTAAVGNFIVTTGGNANTVTAVAVNGSTVVLTLTTAVTNGQAVTVAYTDPRTSNDANAVQDASGNDAATLVATTVTNSVAAPAPAPAPDPGPTPTPAPAPAPGPSTPADNDGVSDAVESAVPSLPSVAGSTLVSGDGNGDGLADAAQKAVVSTPFRDTSSITSNPNAPSTFVTLVADSQDGKANTSTANITSIVQKDAPAVLPEGMKAPLGLIGFTASIAQAGSNETFSLYVDPNLGVNGYWKQDASGTWANLASEAYGGKMVSEGGKLRLDFQIVDGGQFDADGVANGSIADPGIVGSMAQSITEFHPKVPTVDHFWF